jgi:hypothetical protein
MCNTLYIWLGHFAVLALPYGIFASPWGRAAPWRPAMTGRISDMHWAIGVVNAHYFEVGRGTMPFEAFWQPLVALDTPQARLLPLLDTLT